MTDEQRPDPILMAEATRNLVDLHAALAADTLHAAPPSAGDKINNSKGTEQPAPGNWSAQAIRADIHHFARHHAQMLLEDRPQTTAHLDGTLEALTTLIATHVGYFTHHKYANIAWAFHDDLKQITYRAAELINPTGTHKTPIGPCDQPECAGTYEITWQETEGDDDVRAWRLSNTHRMATCNKNTTHRIDSMLYAAGIHE